MRKDTLEFAKKKYFNGYSDTRSVQENFDLLTSFIQDSAVKNIPSVGLFYSLDYTWDKKEDSQEKQNSCKGKEDRQF